MGQSTTAGALEDMLKVLRERAPHDALATAVLHRYDAGEVTLSELAAGLVLILLAEHDQLREIAKRTVERYGMPVNIKLDKP